MERFEDHYRYHLEWRDDLGRDFAELIVMPVGPHNRPDPARLGDAKRAHAKACEGRWVRDGMVQPHVSALKLVRQGRSLPEDIAPKADWCEDHSRFGCGCVREDVA